jgi:electron transfer flavoprotein alpha subunit
VDCARIAVTVEEFRSQNILFLAHVDESGKSLPRAAFEVLGAALDVAAQTGGVPTIGLIGEDVQDAADRLASTGARILSVSGPEFTHPRYSTDAAAAEAICRATSPELVIVPSTSRFLRVIPGVAQRLNGQVDSHITAIENANSRVSATRWFYRQRLEAAIQRDARPWFLLMDSG